jgi:hypothetical protein
VTGEPPANPIRTFVGVALVVVGVLMALLCGLCTLIVVGASLTTSDPQGLTGSYVVFGVAPTAIGVLLTWAGAAVLRSGRKGG